jgi:hypothetical protein
VGDGALGGGRGGAYGSEGKGKEKQTFFWKKRQRNKREVILGFYLVFFSTLLTNEESRHKSNRHEGGEQKYLRAGRK